MKGCKSCMHWKPLDQFYVHRLTRDGRRGTCIECWKIQNKRPPEYAKQYREKNLDRLREYDRTRRLSPDVRVDKALYDRKYRKLTANEQKNRKLKRNFGITLDDYTLMLKDQNGLCSICQNPSKTKNSHGGIKSLCVDHCHKTGKVRSLLCDPCNRALGLFRDNLEVMRRAAAYLEMHGTD